MIEDSAVLTQHLYHFGLNTLRFAARVSGQYISPVEGRVGCVVPATTVAVDVGDLSHGLASCRPRCLIVEMLNGLHVSDFCSTAAADT